jgi:hypothetical protein
MNSSQKGKKQQETLPAPAWLPGLPEGAPAKMYLKGERVQLLQRLESLPGWQLLPGHRAIDRLRGFASADLARTYAGFAEKLARSSQLPISVHVSDRFVLLVLRGPRNHGRTGPLTERVFELARQLG